MNKKEFINLCRKGNRYQKTIKSYIGRGECSFEAQNIVMKLNTSYHSNTEVIELFSELTGRKVDSSFVCLPPFYSNFGKNIFIGRNVFFNIGCSFQDRGGIYIGDGAQMGMNVTICTLSHGLSEERRNTTYPHLLLD